MVDTGSHVVAQSQVVAVTAGSGVEDGPVHVWDVGTGTAIATLKGNMSDCHAIAFAKDLVVASQRTKNQVLVWRWTKDQPLLRFGVPERLTAVALSKSGRLCAGGGSSGKTFLWEVSTGELLRVWDAHYGRVCKLLFTDDDEMLLTAGDDAAVNVWRTQALIRASSDTTLTARHCWTAHTLPITDVACGTLGGSRGWVATCSLDHTCKVWNLTDGSALFSVTCPSPLRSIAFTANDTRIAAGASDGRIYVLDLYRRNVPVPQQPSSSPSSSAPISAYPISASGLAPRPANATILASADAKDLASACVFVLHAHSNGAVLSVSASIQGNTLLSSGDDGQIHLWDLTYRQLVKSFTPQKGAVTSAQLIPRPVWLDSLASAQTTLTQSKSMPLPPPIAQFKRALRSREEERVVYAPLFGANYIGLSQEALSSTTTVTALSSSTQADASTTENLEEQVRRLQALNQQLFDAAAASLLKQQQQQQQGDSMQL